MSRRPIQGGFDAGAAPDEDPGVSGRDFKDALSWWATTVTVVAARADAPAGVLATTVSSFAPVSASPPVVVVSLGATAQVLPLLGDGAEFVVSLLGRNQDDVASRYADSFPVGPSPFPSEGPPVVQGCVLALRCAVDALHETPGGARLVTGRVEEVVPGPAEAPLLYWRREYRGLEE